ncbi:MAG: primosomal protein N' [Gammaproteobacteria bacterium]|nr:primosomal protein N' [Gammaproteobacteria bacterium]
MPAKTTVLRVAVPTPVYRTFDYLPPNNHKIESLTPGMRLRIPFGRARLVGVLISIENNSRIESSRLKKVIEVLDEQSLLPANIMQLLRWVNRYYHCPPGECYTAALPILLRKGEPAIAKGETFWSLTPAGHQIEPDTLKRAPRQYALFLFLRAQPDGVKREQLESHSANWQNAMRELIKKGWVESKDRACVVDEIYTEKSIAPQMNTAQQAAVHTVSLQHEHFQPYLLEGVTGSGKTEVYLNIIKSFVARGLQALVLVPEIGLTPQLLERFRNRLQVPVAVLHSGLSDQERLVAWLMASNGEAPVVIGTRSAVFTPLAKPGIIVVDEEHDISLKQLEGFRYHARDVAVMRARQLDIPIVLGTATPSLESLYNVEQNKYQHLVLPERAGTAIHPELKVIDLRRIPMPDKISPTLATEIKKRLQNKEQVLLFLNRRGFAPTLICHDCGWTADCERCNTHMTLHRRKNKLRCHHCGAERAVPKQCPSCDTEEILQTLGQGTERIEDALAERFPTARILRIDRDSTRRKGSLQTMLDQIHAGDVDILVGTQMLAKGHDFPNVTLVGVLDMDQGLMSADFRASERMAQLLVQVAGRAGRAEKPGEVLIQTHYPDHPLLQTLLKEGYPAFARAALKEREQSGLPPYSAMTLLRAESVNEKEPMSFLSDARQIAEQQAGNNVFILGPVPAPMEKRAGRFRAQLLIQAEQRNHLQQLLTNWVESIESLKSARKVRWSIDVDPMETY